jgi:hypothetical protein
MKTLRYLSLLFLLLTAGCATSNVKTLIAKQGGEKFSPEQVLSLTEGNTLYVYSHDSDAYLYMDTSGRVFGVDNAENKDIGQWDVSEQGEFCVRMNNWWASDMQCYYVYSVGNEYKLTGDKGLIKLSAKQYPGDYKHSYYAIHKGKKSFRKSLRSGSSHISEAREEESAIVDTTADSPIIQKSIIEENTYSLSREDKELRTTVKWMAKDCPGCNLAETNLTKADLVGAKLAGANLRRANLKMAQMRRADLEGANLEDAILSFCNLPGANLKNANLRGADLHGANLIRADLSGADLTGANLVDAHLEGVKGLIR